MMVYSNKFKTYLGIAFIIFSIIPCSAQEVILPANNNSLVGNYSQKMNISEGMSLDNFAKESPSAAAHKVLGYMTVACGLLTGVLSPDNVGDGVHKIAGYTSAGLAGATLGFGFLAHKDKINTNNGMDSTNIHMILGIAGGTMMLISPFVAPDDAHKILGELGALTMGISIVAKLAL